MSTHVSINPNTTVRVSLGDSGVERSTVSAVYDRVICHRSMVLVLAQAVKGIFPTVKLVEGGCDEDGFWYDFDFLTRPRAEAAKRIEGEIDEILHADLPFTSHCYARKRAFNMMERFGETYKAQLAKEADGDSVTLYEVGDFWDLTEGPMVPSTACLSPCSLHLSKVQRDGKTLVRVYGQDR